MVSLFDTKIDDQRPRSAASFVIEHSGNSVGCAHHRQSVAVLSPMKFKKKPNHLKFPFFERTESNIAEKRILFNNAQMDK